MATVKEIFIEARELSGPDRQAFLDGACGADPHLRAEVEAYLVSEGQAANFLPHTQTAVNVGPADVLPLLREAAGAVIGRYKLLQTIGEGGFGVVYMAEQETPVKRRVALKVIKAGMDTKQVIARFEAERQALAMMDHPNIARVLDAGATETGRPYFVMELVKGIPITDYCDQAKLNTKQRLSLFMDVCGAVQHAHQKGIIHRDLKPSNVMVTLRDDKPIVKVIDFGIAKATEQKLTEKTLFTAYGQMIGTPAYMSPEQAVMSELDVDTRSDVYSLGVLLYELLIGSTPFDSRDLRSAGFDEMRRIIREQQPQKPSTKLSTLADATKLTVAGQRQVTPAGLGSQLNGDLDCIVLKAIEKDRQRRYESASAFAQDIQRHLDGESVIAAPPSAGYRLRKFVRRNKTPMTVAAVIALLLLAGTTISTSLAIRATRAKAEAKNRLTQIEKADEIMGSIFENLDPKEIASAERPLQSILVEKLDKAVELLQGDAIGDPVVVAAMQDKFGRSLLGLGEPQKAVVLLQQAVATRHARLGDGNPRTLESMSNLAVAYHYAGDLDHALPLSEQTLRLMKASLGADHPETLSSMHNLASVYQDLGKLDLALPLYEQTLSLRKARLGVSHPDTLVSMNGLGAAYRDAGRPGLALPLLQETLKLRKTQLGPDHPDTLVTMNNLAAAWEDAGKRELALKLYDQTLNLKTVRLGPEHPSTLTSMNNLALAYHHAGDVRKAVPLFEKTLTIRQKLGIDHPDTLISMTNLASAYQDAGRADLALPLFEGELELLRARLGTDHPKTIVEMKNLAQAYENARKPELALPLFEGALEMQTSKLGPDHPDTLSTMGDLAGAYQDAGDLAKAVALFEKTRKLMTEKLGSDHLNTLRCMGSLARAYQAAGDFSAARRVSQETLKLMKARLGADDPETLEAMNNLASVYQDGGETHKAVSLFEETVGRMTAKLGPGNPKTLTSMSNLAQCYVEAGDARASALAANVLAGWRATLPAGSLQFTAPLALLGDSLLKAREFGKAKTLLTECLEIRQKSQPDAWTTFNTQSMLGGALAGLKEYAEAEPLLVEGYQGMYQRDSTIPPPFRARIAEALERLIQFYDVRGGEGNAEKAASYRTLLERRTGLERKGN